MSTNTKQDPTAKSPARRERTLPPGYRVLHVQVPEKVFNGAKAKALLFGIDWPEFVVQLLTEVALSKDDLVASQVGPPPAAR